MNSKKQTHISKSKKRVVESLSNLMNKKTIMIVSVKSLPSPQLQSIRKKLRPIGEIKIAKKSLIRRVLENTKKQEFEKLKEFVDENCAILFSNNDAFELSGVLSENKSPAKAKPGQESPEDIRIEAGPTGLMPGPDISLLSSAGLQVKVEGGKLSIQKAHVVVKKGEQISANVATILTKLNINPFSIGLEPIAALCNGNVYRDIKINKQEIIEELKEKFARGLAFAVSLNYAIKATIPFILGKAAMHEMAIMNLMNTQEIKSGKQEN